MEEQVNYAHIFTGLSEAIASRYVAQVQMVSIEKGSKPTFDELLAELKNMEKELATEGAKFIDKVTKSNANVSKSVLTEEVKNIILQTIQSFISKL